ncbi:serine/threonine-protein kinase Chk1-like [Oratosquilla oratoria]|uniref:serine/threonine-protein kinase Chk1-like n=1 Tax=Oratosquilla oratoria TaxID=337810 RepID=UPI003F760AB7
MQFNSFSSVNGDQEVVQDAIRAQRTSRDFAKEIQLTVGSGLGLNVKQQKMNMAGKANNKCKRSQSADERSYVNKKLRDSDDNNVQCCWKDVQFLGRGGFGSVQLLQDISSGRLCAKKSVKIYDFESQKEEVEIHVKLHHENVIGFFGGNTDQEYIYIYLEYASGGTVHHRIGATGLPEETARRYFVQLIAGVTYLHSIHITHRDLKPENLLLSSSDVVKIGDFGLACEFVEGEHLSLPCGTKAYNAPEVFYRHYKGEQADIWACGIILYKLLTGRNPWRKALIVDPDFEIWSDAITLEVTSEMHEEDFWPEFSKETFGIFEKILVPSKDRATLSSIQQNAWVQG